jgi:PIN domain nuclease of toxin-antitoxin system
MRILLDTKAWAWWLTDNALLSDEARRAVVDPTNEVFVSVVSIWELAFKSPHYVSSAPQTLTSLAEWAAQDGFHIVPIDVVHVLYPLGRRLNFRDPFDLILIGQAQTHGFVVVTDNHRPFQFAKCEVIYAKQLTARDRSGGRGGRSRSSRPTG